MQKIKDMEQDVNNIKHELVEIKNMLHQILTKGDKNVSKRRAQELFPALKVTHAIADALLIAEFARRAGK